MAIINNDWLYQINIYNGRKLLMSTKHTTKTSMETELEICGYRQRKGEIGLAEVINLKTGEKQETYKSNIYEKTTK